MSHGGRWAYLRYLPKKSSSCSSHHASEPCQSKTDLMRFNIVNHNVERQRRRGAIEQLPFQLGIHPINWVGEDVKEHGDATTFEQILDDIQRSG